MREVHLRYNTARLMNTDLSLLLKVCDRMTLMATLYHEHSGGWIRQVYKITLGKGSTIADLQAIPYLDVEQHIDSQMLEGDMVHTIVALNHHPLGLIGHAIKTAVVAPGSELSKNGSIIIIRGTTEGVKRLVDGLKGWEEPNSISVVSAEEGESNGILSRLTERQLEIFELAFKGGYYDSPRRIQLSELAAKAGIARVTLSGHLRAVEKEMAASLVKDMVTT